MRSLRSRLIISHLLPILVILPVLGGAFIYLVETQVLLTGNTNELVRQAVLVAEVAANYTEIWYDPDRAQAFVSQIGPRVNARLLLLDPSGRLMVSSNPADTPRVGQSFNQANIARLLDGEINPQVNYEEGQVSQILAPVITGDGRLMGLVRLDNPLAEVYARSQALRRATLWVMLGCLVLGAALGSILATDIARPVRRVTDAVAGVALHSPSQPIAEAGPAEMRALTRAFNTLALRLSTLEEGRRRLLANLVHELGRPLGALRSGVQALRGGADEDPQLRRELLAGMDGEMARLQELMDELAHLHDQVLGPLELDVRPVNLSTWLTELSAPWREAALEKGLTWEASIPPDLGMLDVDPDRLAQALGNLLSNAVRYSPQGKTISLAAIRGETTLDLSVADCGPGLEPAEREQIFSPFYRGKAARRFSDGMGLGLTIARDLVIAHGGSLEVESQPGAGSRFVIRLPLE